MTEEMHVLIFTDQKSRLQGDLGSQCFFLLQSPKLKKPLDCSDLFWEVWGLFFNAMPTYITTTVFCINQLDISARMQSGSRVWDLWDNSWGNRHVEHPGDTWTYRKKAEGLVKERKKAWRLKWYQDHHVRQEMVLFNTCSHFYSREI